MKVAIGMGYKVTKEMMKKMDEAVNLAGTIHESNVELENAVKFLMEEAIKALETRDKKTLEKIMLVAVALGAIKACNIEEVAMENEKGEIPDVTH